MKKTTSRAPRGTGAARATKVESGDGAVEHGIVVNKEMLEEAAAVKAFLDAADHYFSAAVANAHDPERVESLKPVYLKMEKAWAAMRLFRLPKADGEARGGAA